MGGAMRDALITPTLHTLEVAMGPVAAQDAILKRVNGRARFRVL